ncbi:MAG TPA: hypothetical protein VGD50_07245, partial [Candidatus Baltobacteraceae bacterium]
GLCLMSAVFVAGCGGGGGGGSTTPSTSLGLVAGTPAPSTTSFAPSLTQVYSDTKLAVVPNEQLAITASGSFTYAPPPCVGCTETPDGKPWTTCVNLGPPAGPAYPAPGLPCWSLIGKIGANGAPFEVGSNFSYTVPLGTSGELFLGVNDNFIQDNTGAWIVTIGVDGG